MSWMVIYLGLLLPTASSDLPESKPGRLIAFVLVLLRMGFTCAPVVTNRAVVSYTAFPPLLLRKRNSGIFLLHWPWSRLHRTLSGILPYEARTFLTSRRDHPCCSNARCILSRIPINYKSGLRSHTNPPCCFYIHFSVLLCCESAYHNYSAFSVSSASLFSTNSACWRSTTSTSNS